MSEEDLYLGLDLSTQQLKAIVLDQNLQRTHEASVIFDTDLPEFRTHGGVVQDKSNLNVVTAPTLLWVKALDILMDRLLVAGMDFAKIASISGTAQQHGSVYWLKNAENTLKTLNPDQFLHIQLNGAFSIQNSPIWMDSSTSQECEILEKAVGGPENLAEITGSKAYERFTGAQIAKIYRNKPESYHNTERISLISSFLCSLFLGKIAPIDISDGSGMNLLDIKSKRWHQKLLEETAPNLKEKLGDVVSSYTILGDVSSYFVDRWCFRTDCKVIAFTGDNPASLIGMRLSPEWLAVSLGTSDTIFLWLNEPKVLLEGHVFCNPLDDEAYMALLCFKNGSLTRERIRDSCANGSWDLFNQLLESTPRGNFGNMGLFYDRKEIIPFVSGDFCYNKRGEKVTKFSSLEVQVRALIEGQFIAKRAHVEDIGFKFNSETKILATGGASKNKAILQVLSDVFNSPVYILDTSNAAVLGSGYQAKYALYKKEKCFKEVTENLPEPKLLCSPFQDVEEIYIPMVEKYRKIIDVINYANC
nr:xylulose kinase-like [Onthophagus taurus]